MQENRIFIPLCSTPSERVVCLGVKFGFLVKPGDLGLILGWGTYFLWGVTVGGGDWRGRHNNGGNGVFSHKSVTNETATNERHKFAAQV